MKKSIMFLLGVLFLTSCEQENFSSEDSIEYREIFTLGDFIITPNTRASALNNMFEITYMRPDGEPGLSINVKEESKGHFSCDYDQNGSTDFYIKFLSNGHILYESESLIPLKEVTLKIEDNKYYIDVVKLYPAQTRALFGGGKETFRECFERRMGSAEGILMLATGGCVSGGLGALAVCAGGALSCALYNPF